MDEETKAKIKDIVERELPGYYVNMTYDASTCWLIEAIKKEDNKLNEQFTNVTFRRKRVFIVKDTLEVSGISEW